MGRRKDSNCVICNKAIITNKTGLCLDCYYEDNKRKTVEHWLSTGDTGCSVTTTIRNGIRDYIYEKQNYCCSICRIPNK